MAPSAYTSWKVSAVCLLILLSAVPYTQGITYYIDAVNGDDRNTGYILSPFASFTPLCFPPIAPSPTAILISKGTYNISYMPCTLPVTQMAGRSGNAADVVLDISAALTFNSPVSVSVLSVSANVPSSAAFTFLASSNISNVLFDVTSGSAVQVSKPITLNVADSVINYDVVDVALPGIFTSIGPLNFTNVYFSGVFHGKGSAISTSEALYMTRSEMHNHRGGWSPIVTTHNIVQLVSCVFKNNTGDFAGVLNRNTGDLPNAKFPKNITIVAQAGLLAPPGKDYLYPPSVTGSPGTAPRPYAYVGATVIDSIFDSNIATDGAGAIFFNANTTDSNAGTFVISNSTFFNNSGTVGAVWLGNLTLANTLNTDYGHSQGAVVGSSTFQQNYGVLFGALLSTSDTMLIDSCSFLDSTTLMTSSSYSTSTVFLLSSVTTVSNSIFDSNSAPFCAHLIVLGTQDQSSISDVFFLSSTTLETAPVCIIGNVAESASNDFAIFNSTFADTTYLQGMTSSLTNATQINLWHTKAILEDYVSLGDSSLSAISIGDTSNITIRDGSATYGSARIPGFIIFASTLFVNPPSLAVTGASAFLTMAGSNLTSNIIANSSTSAAQITFAASGNESSSMLHSTWLQQANFVGIQLLMQRSTVVCCNAGDIWGPITFDANSYIEFQSGEHWWLNNHLPVVFQSSSSPGLIVDTAATLHVTYPTKLLEAPQRINGIIAVYGIIELMDVVVTGSLTIRTGGTLKLFPSLWNGVDHRAAINGALEIGGSILLDETFALLPFMPIIATNGSQTFPVLEYVTTSSYSPSQLGSNYVYYNPSSAIGGGIVSGASTVVKVTPTALVPYSHIDDTGSAIYLQFLLPPARAYGCDEFGFSSTQFDMPSLSCLWVSPTELRVASTSLPSDPSILTVQTADLAIRTPYYGINAARAPVKPKARLVTLPPVIPCGSSITLDGTLSTGLGSYPATFRWALAAPTGASSLATFVGYHTTTVIVVPSYLLSPNTAYSFTLQVTNFAGLMSPVAVVNTTTVGSAAPRLRLTGPNPRNHYVGNPLLLTAEVVPDACAPSNVIIYSWNGQVNGTSYASSSTTSPSISLSPLYFLRPTNGLIISLAASYFGSSVNTTVQFAVNVQEAPFFLVQDSPSVFFDSNPILTLGVRGSFVLISSVSWSLTSCPSVDGSHNRALASSAHSSDFGNAISSSASVANPQIVCQHQDGSSFPVNISPNLLLFNFSASIDHTTLDYGRYAVTATVLTQRGASASLDFTFDYLPTPPVSPPSVFIHVPLLTTLLQPSTKVKFESSVDGRHFSNQTGLIEFSWTILSGVSSTSTALDGPNLVIPFLDLIPGELLSVNLVATNVSTGLSTSCNATFAPATGPFGGALSVSPSAGNTTTVFSFTSSPWSTLYPPLRYQFALTVDQGSVTDTVYLTGLLASPRISTTFPILNQYATQLTTSENVTATLVLYVVDGTGTWSTSQVDIEVALDPLAFWSTNLQIGNMVNDVKAAVNESDWLQGTASAAVLMTAMRGRMLYLNLPNATQLNVLQELAFNATNWFALDYLFYAIPTLASSLVSDDKNSPALLGFVRSGLHFLKDQPSWFNAGRLFKLILLLIDVGTSSNGPAVGKVHQYAWHTTTSMVDAAAVLLEMINQNQLSGLQDLASSLMPFFGNAVMSSVYPGENALNHSASFGGLAMAASQCATSPNSAPVLLDYSSEFGVSTWFKPSDHASETTTGYVGYHHIVYNGTYPNASDASATNSVVVLTVTPYGGSTSKKAVLVTSQVLVNFTGLNSTEIDEAGGAHCATYDEATSTWVSTCTATQTSSSSISCDCSSYTSGTPLTVLFGYVPPPPGEPANGGPQLPLSVGAIAAIASVGGVALIAALVVTIVLVSMKARRAVQPYYGTGGRVLEAKQKKAAKRAQREQKHDLPPSDVEDS